jgi:hypothetical protein
MGLRTYSCDSRQPQPAIATVLGWGDRKARHLIADATRKQAMENDLLGEEH